MFGLGGIWIWLVLAFVLVAGLGGNANLTDLLLALQKK